MYKVILKKYIRYGRFSFFTDVELYHEMELSIIPVKGLTLKNIPNLAWYEEIEDVYYDIKEDTFICMTHDDNTRISEEEYNKLMERKNGYITPMEFLVTKYKNDGWKVKEDKYANKNV